MLKTILKSQQSETCHVCKIFPYGVYVGVILRKFWVVYYPPYSHESKRKKTKQKNCLLQRAAGLVEDEGE